MFLVSTRLHPFDRDEASVSADAFARRALDLGAAGAEIGPWLSEARLRELLATLPRAGCPVVAIDGPSPRPEGSEHHPEWRDAMSLADPDPSRRVVVERAVRRTLERASEAAARVVIVELGRVRVEADREARLAASSLSVAVPERSLAARPFFDAARRSLDALLPAAERWGLRLAVATPARLADLPAMRELDHLAREFSGSPLRVWLDVGGAHVLEARELKRVSDWIRAFGGILDGAWLRDVVKPDEDENDDDSIPLDARAWLRWPGQGRVDFEALRALVREAAGSREFLASLSVEVEDDPGITREAVSHLRRAGWLE